MRKVILITAVVVLVFASASFGRSAWGTVFGAMSTASTLGMGQGNFGLGVGWGDNARSFMGSFNYGLSTHMDGRIKLALVDPDGGDAKLGVGADFKYQIVSVGGISNGPFDMAVGGLFEFYDLGGVSVIQLGGHYTGSYPVKLESGGVLTPYGRLNVRMEMLDYDGETDSDLQIGLNGGVHWQVNKDIGLFGEFQIDGNDGVFLGIEFGAL